MRYGKKFYVVRLRKDDTLVAAGSAKDCARIMGMSLSSFHATVCRCRAGTNRRYAIDVEPWEEAEE